MMQLSFTIKKFQNLGPGQHLRACSLAPTPPRPAPPQNRPQWWLLVFGRWHADNIYKSVRPKWPMW